MKFKYTFKAQIWCINNKENLKSYQKNWHNDKNCAVNTHICLVFEKQLLIK